MVLLLCTNKSGTNAQFLSPPYNNPMDFDDVITKLLKEYKERSIRSATR
jgi:hypothetical protein